MPHATMITRCPTATFDSRTASCNRVWKNCESDATKEMRFWRNPACPAGLRNGIGRPAIQCSLTTEDQAKHEPDAERGEDRLGRVFSDVLLSVLLETANAIAGIVPDLLGPAPILVGHGPRRGAKILRCLAGVGCATLHFAFCLRRDFRALCHIFFVSHIFLLVGSPFFRPCAGGFRR